MQEADSDEEEKIADVKRLDVVGVRSPSAAATAPQARVNTKVFLASHQFLEQTHP
jgi:hypothetical protein